MSSGIADETADAAICSNETGMQRSFKRIWIADSTP